MLIPRPRKRRDPWRQHRSILIALINFIPVTKRVFRNVLLSARSIVRRYHIVLDVDTKKKKKSKHARPKRINTPQCVVNFEIILSWPLAQRGPLWT